MKSNKKSIKRRDKRLEQIGALWVRETQLGKEYLTGLIDGREVVIFENKYRTESKHPYWIILVES